MINRFHQEQPAEYAQIGKVMLSGDERVGVSANLDAQSAIYAAPYGVYAKPCEGDHLLLLPTADGKYVSLGVMSAHANLKSGELMLKAASGAYVWLKETGEVEINGLVIDKNGTIQ